MKYEVILRVHDDYDLKMPFDIETKGKGKKVLRAAIKKEIISFLKENDNQCGEVTNIEILDIIKLNIYDLNKYFLKKMNLRILLINF